MAGGTLIKGLNRATATLVAGFVAVGAHKVANLGGSKGEPIILATFIFLTGTDLQYLYYTFLCPCTLIPLSLLACVKRKPGRLSIASHDEIDMSRSGALVI